MSEIPDFGPIQMLVLGFDDPSFTGEILPELARLNDEDVIRLVDLLVVSKNADGEVEVMRSSSLSGEDAEAFGAVVGALIGLGAGDVALADEWIHPGDMIAIGAAATASRA
jgi:uncharacterized membrane protein